MQVTQIIQSLVFFFFWPDWLREDRSAWFGVLGGAVLVLYGIIPTWQPAHFGRVYAAYGGIFIVLSILWGWKIDKIEPDAVDLISGAP